MGEGGELNFQICFINHLAIGASAAPPDFFAFGTTCMYTQLTGNKLALKLSAYRYKIGPIYIHFVHLCDKC